MTTLKARLQARTTMEPSAGDLASVLLEWAPDALVVADRDGLIRLINRRTTDLFGYEPGELVGRPVEMLIPERSRSRHPDLRTGFFEAPSVRPMGAGLQLWGVRKDGTEFPVDISLSPVSSSDGPVVAAAIRDITDRLAAEDALREARDEAQRASRAKSEFLSRMSHELRTPLTAILGFTELLQVGNQSPEARADFLRRVHRAGKHLLNLINDVLDISRVEGGSLTLSMESVAVSDVIEEAVALLEPLASSRGVVFDVSTTAVGAHADLNRLRQVLINVLSNAVKYNRPDGTVSLAVDQDGDRVRIAVSDTGRGIHPDDFERLFAPFERLGLERSTQPGAGDAEGTGIGLSLSRGLVELMGGTIAVQSEPGVGSTFTIELPAGDPLMPMPAVASSRVSEPWEAPRPGAQILYIEDNASNAVLIGSALSLRPHIAVKVAGAGRAGFDKAAMDGPDLILLDLHLPDVSGQEVLAWLKRDPRTARIPVVVVSADATEGTRRQLLDAGAAAYVTKPLVVRDFVETVETWLNFASSRS